MFKKAITIIDRHILVALALSVAACLLLTGCGTSRTAREEGSISVYYLNKERTSIVAADYIPDAGILNEEHAEDLVQDLLACITVPMDAASQIAAMDDTMVQGWALSDGILTLNMSSDYRRLGRTEEILVRAALVNTLCGVHGVDSVALTVDGDPILDEDGGTVRSQSGEDYIFSSDSELRSYERVRLHLYFADESGTRLVSTYRTVVYNSNVALERLVTEEVIKGPNTDVVYATINPKTSILSVTTRDGTCYVNLDRNYLSDPYDVTARVAIYSLVNSLTELESVSAVQIRIEGEVQNTFMDISLQEEFERDLSLVGNT